MVLYGACYTPFSHDRKIVGMVFEQSSIGNYRVLLNVMSRKPIKPTQEENETF